MNSNKKKFTINRTTFIVVCMLLTACGSKRPKDENADTAFQDSVAVEKPEANPLSYSLPSPLQIASIFNKSGLQYQSDLTSPFKNPAKYTTNLSKSINLGIYSADLAYCVLNKQTQEAMNFMKLCRQIAESLGIGGVFDERNLSQRFEKNLENKDSLACIIAELQMETDIYLEENEQTEVTAIAFSGAWVESMYVGSKIYEKTKDKSMNAKLTEQMTILDNIINALKVVEKKDPAITGLIADIQLIEDIYDELPSVKASPVKEDEKITLTDDEVLKVTKKISQLRTKFIKE